MANETSEPVAEKFYLKVNPAFKHRVLKAPHGETFKFCYQCGRCTATCPIARFTSDFRPNKLIQMAKLGIEEVLGKASLWLCAACYTCTERCPQGIEVKDVIRILKNLALDDGHYPDFYRGLTFNLLRTGLAYTISGSRLRQREKYGLPPLPTTKTGDIRTLAELSGVSKLTAKEGGDA
jgi:heterodisulfide reductase subunit C